MRNRSHSTRFWKTGSRIGMSSCTERIIGRSDSRRKRERAGIDFHGAIDRRSMISMRSLSTAMHARAVFPAMSSARPWANRSSSTSRPRRNLPKPSRSISITSIADRLPYARPSCIIRSPSATLATAFPKQAGRQCPAAEDPGRRARGGFMRAPRTRTPRFRRKSPLPPG